MRRDLQKKIMASKFKMDGDLERNKEVDCWSIFEEVQKAKGRPDIQKYREDFKKRHNNEVSPKTISIKKVFEAELKRHKDDFERVKIPHTGDVVAFSIGSTTINIIGVMITQRKCMLILKGQVKKIKIDDPTIKPFIQGFYRWIATKPAERVNE